MPLIYPSRRAANSNAEISVKRIDVIKSNELEIDQSKDLATDLDKLEDDANPIVIETIDVDLDISFIPNKFGQVTQTVPTF